MAKKVNYALTGPVWGPWVDCGSHFNLGQVPWTISVEACSDADAAGPFQVEVNIPGFGSRSGIDSVTVNIPQLDPPLCTVVKARVKNTGVHFPPVYLLVKGC